MLAEENAATLAHYRIGPVIGVGGMGVVHEAWDLHRRRSVALKRLRGVNPGAVGQLKQEFRRASELRHPNLVRMYEMLEVGGECFFTMELVRGTSIAGAAVPPTQSASSIASDDGAAPPLVAAHAPRRVRTLFAQLARALVSVHDAGLLHLDLQPSNVLVDAEDRVVLLDFGLASAYRDRRARARGGTPGFVAPEMRLDPAAPPTPAADWYGFGVLLAWTLGDAPGCDDTEARTLRMLADALTRPTAAERPRGDEVLERLGERRRAPTEIRSGERSRFVGRETELAALSAALDRARRGSAAIALLRGPAGIGKSRLLREFVRRGLGMPVLSGAFRRNERTPYQGLDELVAAAAEQLNGAGATPIELAPAEIDALGRMFPVLARAVAPDWDPDIATGTDSIELRRVGTGALITVFRSLATRTPCVITIEDAHLADADSVRVLDALVSAALPGLFVITRRPDASAASRALDAIRPSSECHVVRLELTPLDPEASRALIVSVRARLHDGVGEPPPTADRGVPLLLEELAFSSDPGTTLESSVGARLVALPPAAARLARVIALAPSCRLDVARACASVDDPEPAVRALEERGLARVAGVGADASLEVRHALIADAIARTIPPEEVKEWHRALARTLIGIAPGDAASIAYHLHRAGDREAVAPHALRAATAAERALAFDAAVELLGYALDSPSVLGSERLAVRRRLADALVCAGRAFEGATEYAALARDVEGSERRELEMLAMQHHLLSGHLEDGVTRLRELTAQLDIPWPGSPASAMARSALRLAWLRLRGIDAPAARVVPLEVARADVSFAAARGLLAVDSIRGAHFALAALHSGLSSGDRTRTARGLLVVGGGVLGALGGGMGGWGLSMIERAREIARESHDPHLEAFALVTTCQAHIYKGDWASAVEHGEAGLALLRRLCAGVAWDTNMAFMGIIRALEELGDLSAARARMSELRQDARTRGDQYAEVTATLYEAFHKIHAGDLTAARSAASAARRLWRSDAYTLQHFYMDRVEIYARLFEGDVDAARHELDRVLRSLRASGLASVPIVAIDAALVEARVALATLGRTRDREHLAWVERIARALDRLDRPDARAHGQSMRGASLAIVGDRAGAVEALASSEHAFVARQMRLASAVAMARRLEAAGEDADAPLEFIRSQGVRDVRAWLDVMLPIAAGA